MWLRLDCLPMFPMKIVRGSEEYPGHVAYVLEGLKQLFEVKSYHLKLIPMS